MKGGGRARGRLGRLGRLRRGVGAGGTAAAQRAAAATLPFRGFDPGLREPSTAQGAHTLDRTCPEDREVPRNTDRTGI